jgi:hypothetical protein
MNREGQYKTLDIISDIIERRHDKEKGYLFRDTRRREVADLRKMFFYFAQKFTRLSLQAIGDYSKVRGRNSPHNHATILYSVRVVKDIADVDKDFRKELQELENEIKFYADYEQYMFDEANIYKKRIVRKIYEEEDLNFLLKYSQITENLYENKNLVDILADKVNEVVTLDRINNEGIHKTTQEDSGLGVV